MPTKESGARDDLAGIRIVEGTFNGLEFQFTVVHFGEQPNDDGTFTVTFDYDILNKDKFEDHLVDRKPELEDALALILTEVVTKIADGKLGKSL